jgi:hypothetical protein
MVTVADALGVPEPRVPTLAPAAPNGLNMPAVVAHHAAALPAHELREGAGDLAHALPHVGAVAVAAGGQALVQAAREGGAAAVAVSNNGVLMTRAVTDAGVDVADKLTNTAMLMLSTSARAFPLIALSLGCGKVAITKLSYGFKCKAKSKGIEDCDAQRKKNAVANANIMHGLGFLGLTVASMLATRNVFTSSLRTLRTLPADDVTPPTGVLVRAPSPTPGVDGRVRGG